MTREELLDMAKACEADADNRCASRFGLDTARRLARIAQHLAEQPDHAQRVDANPPMVPPAMTVRAAAKLRQPLDGADAQALEHALTITEKERDEAQTEVGWRRQRARDASHTLIELIGAPSPESIDETSKRAADVIVRLRAEVERLKADQEALVIRGERAEDERDKLRAEVERLRTELAASYASIERENAAAKEAKEARAEVERLASPHHHSCVHVSLLIAAEKERDDARAELNQLAARGAGDDAYIEGLREGIADAQAEAIAMVDLLRNLVAVIDRDGGQRQDGEHISVTAARATETVVGMIQQLDNTAAEIVPRLTKERDEARGATDKTEMPRQTASSPTISTQIRCSALQDLAERCRKAITSNVEDAKARADFALLNLSILADDLLALTYAAPPAEIVPPKPAEALVDTSEEWTLGVASVELGKLIDAPYETDAFEHAKEHLTRAHAAGRREGLEEAAKECEDLPGRIRKLAGGVES